MRRAPMLRLGVLDQPELPLDALCLLGAPFDSNLLSVRWPAMSEHGYALASISGESNGGGEGS